MHKGRMEAFSDGVLAIIVTIMVLELRPPHEVNIEALRQLLPVFLSYVLSFVFLAIYWNNHHHMLQAVKHVNGSVLWANMHLLFWLSLVPFSTAWLGEHGLAQWPTAFYGFNLMLCGIAYYILSRILIRANGRDSDLAVALGRDVKGKFSVFLYLLSIALAFVMPMLSALCFILVAVIWLVPDKRMERIIE